MITPINGLNTPIKSGDVSQSSKSLGLLLTGCAIQSEYMDARRPNQALAVALSCFSFMKQFSVFATLIAANGGSAPSR